MIMQRVQIAWCSALLPLLKPFVPSGTVYELYFNPFCIALMIHYHWDLLFRKSWQHVSDSEYFIPLVIPTWATLSTYFLWYATILTTRLHRFMVFIPLAALTLQPFKALLPPIISRMSRLGLSCHDILQSLTSRQRYNLQALPSEAHIRLVRLRGFLFWRDIQILAYLLDACPAFEAISYTWDGQAQQVLSLKIVAAC
jgi:hypothetical protein